MNSKFSIIIDLHMESVEKEQKIIITILIFGSPWFFYN